MTLHILSQQNTVLNKFIAKHCPHLVKSMPFRLTEITLAQILKNNNRQILFTLSGNFISRLHCPNQRRTIQYFKPEILNIFC